MDIGYEYELDEEAVANGVWFRLVNGNLLPVRFLKPPAESAEPPAEFRLRPTDTQSAQRAMEASQRQHRKALEKGDGDPDYERALIDIQAATLADAVVVDWRNVEDHGQPLPYSRDAAFEILKKYHRLRRAVDVAASAVAPYRPERDGAAVGN